ncbi:MAG: hypothetical protein ACO3NB_09420 [Ilumatobacteraceae bacterium]
MNTTTTNHDDTNYRTYVRRAFGHARVRIDQHRSDAPIEVYATDVNGFGARLIATFEPGPTVRFKEVVRMAEDSAIGQKTRESWSR